MTHLRLDRLGTGSGIRVREHERVSCVLDRSRGIWFQGADTEDGTLSDVGGWDGVAEIDVVVGGGVGEVDAVGGVEGGGKDVGDYGGFF